jgi:hypothetical protein
MPDDRGDPSRRDARAGREPRAPGYLPGAGEERLEVRALADRSFPSFQVRNPLHETRYEVYAPAYPADGPWLCECPDYAHRGAGRCKHIDAVRSWIAVHPVAPSAPTPEVPGRDAARRLAELLREPATDESLGTRRRLRWAEAILEGGSSSARSERAPPERSPTRRTTGPG